MTSVATLFRKAKKAKSPKTAAKLRKQAAEMRQSRGVKRRKVKRIKIHDVRVKHGNGGLQAARDQWTEEAHREALKRVADQYKPGDTFEYRKYDGPREPGDISDHALNAIMQNAKKVPEFSRNMVRQAVAAAAQDARQLADEKHNDELKTMSEIAHINVLCAFIADMEGNQSLYGGALPPSVMVSGMTVARLVAQLREDGYTVEGRRGVDRKNIHKNLI